MDETLQRLRIDETRLWQSIEEMAQVGPGRAGGCNRQALTDEDKQGRDLFVSWARAANCAVAARGIDAVQIGR